MFHIISTHSLTKRLTCLCRYFSRRIAISTHSLTKRLTVLISGMAFDMHISTHSLTKRLTAVIFPPSPTFAFQLTASRRGWQFLCLLLSECFHISTHSLTKRLTGSLLSFLFTSIFQLTASRRGWQSLIHPILLDEYYFNSQPHEEADFHSTSYRSHIFISTHSLTKRLTAILHKNS